MTGHDAFFAIGDRLMAALEACDAEAVRATYAPDARLWHNFDEKYQSVEENVRLLQWLHGRLENVKYDVVGRDLLEDGFVQRHVLRGTLKSGEEFAMPACCIIRIEGDRIVSMHEYLDSAQAALLSRD